jgi:light-regulated signal transduction histidine kinase (bacteriophytochrome)
VAHPGWRHHSSYNIAQTTDGFLWITTAQGLMRFDGVRFMRWQPPQGQNLGLAIIKSIVESHGGRIWANGDGGRGATFHFIYQRLPRKRTRTGLSFFKFDFSWRDL